MRLTKFESLQNHAWLGKQFKKLNASELKFCRDFIQTNDSLNKNDFEIRVNRMFIFNERPKNWTIILELLSCINSNQEK